MNRVEAADVRHDLEAASELIEASNSVQLNLSTRTRRLIAYINEYGPDRYLVESTIAFGKTLVDFDRAVWELRRFCSRAVDPSQFQLQHLTPAPRVRIPGGYLEHIVASKRHPAREPLLWQNAFFGERVRRRVRIANWFEATNAPLYLHPILVKEVKKYVHLPKEAIKHYQKVADAACRS